jgi:superfamily II DNA or RNA helicase
MKNYILECLEEQGERPITARRLAEELRNHSIHCLDEEVEKNLKELLSEGRVKNVNIGLKHPGWLIASDDEMVATDIIPEATNIGTVEIVVEEQLQVEIPVAEAPPPQLPMNPASTLHAWQEKAWDAWEGAGYQGMLEAITGSGKTVFAIECAKRLSRLHRPLNTLIVVPTIPLMHQWKKSIEKFAGDDFSKVGLLGDGHEDNFSKSPIVISVVNSASKRVYELLQHTLGSDARVKSLLIADEVHRYQNAAQFGRVLEFPYSFKLGMSATIDHFEDPRLGKVFFSYGFSDAKADGLIDQFDMVNVAIPLNGKEQTEYNDLSEQFKDQLDKVKNLYSDELKRVPDDWLFVRLKQISDRDPDATPDIKRLFSILFRRSRVTHVAVNKIGLAKKITALLVKEARRKSIVFFERIQSAVDVEDDAIKTAAEDLGSWVRSQDYGLWCKTIHSGHNRTERASILEEFRNRTCAALLTCRMLDEGLDVPEIDAAVLVSSTQTLRQRIQRIGRALRKSPHGKRPLIVSLYIPGTGDQNTTQDDYEVFGDVAKIYEANISNCMSIIRKILGLNN